MRSVARVLCLFILSVTLVAPAAAADREVRVLGIAGPSTAGGDLLRPGGKSSWHLEEAVGSDERIRSFLVDGSAVTVTDRWSEEKVATIVYRDLLGGDAAVRWVLPDRYGDLLKPGIRETLHLSRENASGTDQLRVYLRTVGIGWVHLPSGPREVALQEALVLAAPEGSGSFVPEAFFHRWIDPRAGVVAEVSGPATPDGRNRVGATEASYVDEVIAGAADLTIYRDEIIRDAPLTRVTYGFEDRWCQDHPTVPCLRNGDCPSGDCPTIPVSSVTPDGYATIGDLIAANSWDFSGRTTGAERASTAVPINTSETCNTTACGYDTPGTKLDREDYNTDDLQYLIKNNQVTELDTTGPEVVWLRAGAQKEGKEGLFGGGESRYCYIGQDRTPVKLWEFAHQDAGGWYMQGESAPGQGDGDSWSSGPFDCEQNIFNEICGDPGLFPELYSKPCGDHAGTQSGEVLKGGVVTLPSGHTVNALLLRTVADFCVYSVTGCSFLFKVDEVRTVVYLWSAPNLGTVALLQSEQNVPDLTSWSVLDESNITFGLFPPVSIQVDSAGDTTVDLSWNPGNITYHIDGYKVYWDTDSGADSAYAFDSETHASQVSIVGTSATISGLDPGTTYYITVTALSDFASPSSGVNTTYESILFPTQVSGDPDKIYPVEVTADTTGGGCDPTAEVTGLLLSKTGGDVELCWDQTADACAVGYDVLGSDTPSDSGSFSTVGSTTGVESTCWTGNPAETYLLVVARGATGAQGPKGHTRD